MIKVYFEIFGKKLVKELNEKEYETMTDEQIGYYIRGKLKIDKIERKDDLSDMPEMFKDIFKDLR